ncbi:hypothetical protein ABT168_26900 [Streptomyces sp. NPDC001793]|uniref:hypothetical protein n=1 Tax=Streptomyces sp. NPDC001793 TaxID=3154657 RepID=UPI0033220A9A
MNTPSGNLQLPVDDAALAFQDLEEFVVSLDRILSRIGAGADPVILVDYLAERRVPARLAHLRGLFGDLLESAIGAEAVEEMAQEGFVYSDDAGHDRHHRRQD